MPTADEEHWLLKVLSGPHMGAELLLGEGEYVIGQDDGCDIVLDDRTLAPRHARLLITNGKARAESVDGELQLAGQTVSAADLEQGQVLALGSSHLGIGAPGATWDDVVLATPLAQDSDERRGASAAETTDPVSGSGSRNALSPTRGGAKIVAFLAVLAAIGLVVAAVYLFGYAPPTSDLSNDTSDTDTVRDELTIVEHVVAGLGLNGVKIRQGPAGRTRVEGYVESRVQENTLNHALKAARVNPIVRVWSPDEVLAGVTMTLTALGHKELTIDYLGDGDIRISGYLGSGGRKSELERAVETVRSDVAGLKRITLEVETQSDRERVLQQMLTDEDLASRVSLSSEPGRVLASGSLGRKESERWKTVLGEFLGRYGSQPEIVSEMEILRPPQVAGKSAPIAKKRETAAPAIKGILRTDAPYVILEGGRLFAQGEIIDGGYRVQSIELTQVILKNGDDTIVYRIGVE